MTYDYVNDANLAGLPAALRQRMQDKAEASKSLPYTVKTKCRSFGQKVLGPFNTLKEAQAAFHAHRDASDEGASTFHDGKIMQGGKQVLYFSYNGRIWNLDGTEAR